ncbi:class I SAM-dependent methyltransferase [Litorilituus lipolyticus]|uniref:Class I SAM-dependent methyltransferase n=1 Tax=Litorilituus lipolyticus TaxID=2491017 RepID=A0A502KQ96_9GAMM|nr:class I SAM-dependent methyltransferase [Litorilituus lipolyticus]TPH13890.1 class I SAM-dependent methyltransferase [Litorilituus lipolyticus]
MFNYSSNKNISAVEALSQAQYIAFSPFIFQATATLKDLNILDTIEDAGKLGISLNEIATKCELSDYGVKVLLDFALSIGVISLKENNYLLSKVGYFLQNDEMSKVNFEFNQHFCYQGLEHLSEAIKKGKPEGLKVFGEWQTLYPALTSLPEKVSKSWFDFDHYYSDHAFDEALKVVFKNKPSTLLDIGGNTGRWSLKCLAHDKDVNIVIMDLAEQLAVATKNIETAGFSNRFTPYPCNMLSENQELYQGADAIWMSQFLDCFSPKEITNILLKVKHSMQPETKLYIMETFIDRQKFEAASFSLNATSLYFTCFANGNSRMYESNDMISLIESAGLTITEQIDQVGLGHTLLVCSA